MELPIPPKEVRVPIPLQLHIWDADSYVPAEDREQLQTLYTCLKGFPCLLNEVMLKDTLSRGHIFTIRRNDHETGHRGPIIGTAMLLFIPDIPPYARLCKFYVMPEFEGCGLGRYIMKNIVETIKKARSEIHTIELHCDITNPLRQRAYAMYERCGFRASPIRMVCTLDSLSLD